MRLLTEEPPAEAFLRRLGQMQLAPAEAPAGLPAGSVCAARGEGPPPEGRPRLLVAPWPADAETATAAAALVSVAKAWDLDGGPRGRAVLCLLPAGAAAPEVGGLVVGPLARGEATRAGARFAAEAADPTTPAERLVYTDVQARVRALYAEL